MAKTKRNPSKLKSLFTERNFTILLLIVLVACVAVLLTKESMRSTDLTDPVTIEQTEQPAETE